VRGAGQQRQHPGVIGGEDAEHVREHLAGRHHNRHYNLANQGDYNHPIKPIDSLTHGHLVLGVLPPSFSILLALNLVPLRLDLHYYLFETGCVRFRALTTPITKVDNPAAGGAVWARVQILTIKIRKEDFTVAGILIA